MSSCFGFGGQQQNRDLHLQVQEVQARLEAERQRHATAEAQWKEVQRELAEAEARLKAEVASLREQAQAQCEDYERNFQGQLPIITEKKANDAKEKIKIQIQKGMKRRDDNFLREYFQRKTKDSGTSALSMQQFTSTLEDLGIHLNEDEVKVIFRIMDVNDDGAMDLEEFTRAVRCPTTIEQLIGTLPLSQIFADALPPSTGGESLRQFGQITPEQIKEICNEALPFVEKMLIGSVEKARIAVEAMDKFKSSNMASKYEVPPEMSAGTVNDFHSGLTGRIGMFFPVFNLPLPFVLRHAFRECRLVSLSRGLVSFSFRRPCRRRLVQSSGVRALQQRRQPALLPDLKLQNHNHACPRVGNHDEARRIPGGHAA